MNSENLYYQQLNRLNKLGIEETAVFWRKAFPEITEHLLPGLTLKGTRQLAGLTQQQLADQTGMSRTQISALEVANELKLWWTRGFSRRWGTAISIMFHTPPASASSPPVC